MGNEEKIGEKGEEEKEEKNNAEEILMDLTQFFLKEEVKQLAPHPLHHHPAPQRHLNVDDDDDDDDDNGDDDVNSYIPYIS